VGWAQVSTCIYSWLVISVTRTLNDLVKGAYRDITFLLQPHLIEARNCADVTVGGIWCVKKMGDHHDIRQDLNATWTPAPEGKMDLRLRIVTVPEVW